MSELFALAPSYHAHSSRPCCGTLDIMCPVCTLHRIPIATCTGPHGSNESAGIKRWLLTGHIEDWSSVSLSPSVDIQGGDNRCAWHGTIQNGQAQP